MLLLAFLACLPTGTLRLFHPPPAIAHTRRPHATIVCKTDADDETKKLLASLNAGMNSWSDFDGGNKQKAPTKNAAKQKTKRKGKDGKIYLRDGPKRPKVVTKLAVKRKDSAAIDAAVSRAEVINSMNNARVRIEESKAGGKKLTIIRGLEALPSERSKEIVKSIKQSLSVGGRVTAEGALEIQGAHAEVCMLRLQKAGFRDVKLAGGARSKKPGKATWNAPKEVRELAETMKQSAKRAEAKAKDAQRAAARSPAAVTAKMLSQLQASEQQEMAKLRRSDLPKAERRLAKEKLERIQQRMAEGS